jgi:hypothetical protein
LYDAQPLLLALYVVGGLLEAVGLLLVAFDVWMDRRRARSLASSVLVIDGGGADPEAPRATPPPGHIELDDALLDIASGNLGRRAWGVGLLLVGLAAQTTANVLAL